MHSDTALTGDSDAVGRAPAGPSGAIRLTMWIIWIIVACAATGMFAFGIPAQINELHQQYDGQLGLVLSRDQSGEIVASPSWNGPAARAGVLDGDVLVAINGVPVDRERSAPLDQLIPVGDAGSAVTLNVRTGDFPVRQYTIARSGDDGLALRQLGLSPTFMTAYSTAVDIACALLFGAIAVILMWRESGRWLTALTSMVLLMVFVGISSPAIALYRAHPNWPLFDSWIALAFVSFCIFFYLFPNGRAVPIWTVGLMGILALWTLAEPFNPQLYPWKMPPLSFLLVVLGWLTTGIVAQLCRFRFHADAVQRQQTKWVVFGATAAALGLLLQIWYVAWPDHPATIDLLYDLAFYPLSRLIVAILPLSIGIAVLRYRLWDIDLIINRTLVYSSLTAGVLGLYVLIAGGLGALLQERGNFLISLLATGVIAIFFHPMRERLQGAINHLMYGERDEPYAVLSRLGQRLGAVIAPDSMLPAVVETVAQALKLPYAAITVNRDGTRTLEAAYGSPAVHSLVLPLVHQAEPIGELILAPRAPGDVFSETDRRLLEDLARETSVAVHAMLLTSELQRSREELVTAREEERRRLRADLHDGLGPTLATVMLKIGAARRFEEPDSVADRLLQEIWSDVQHAVADIRRLVYALRPPVLDELGLLQAICHDAEQYRHGGLQVRISVPAELPPLPAAVEVAVYRMAHEALTNVVRHAKASVCTLQLDLVETPHGTILELRISDDGRGMSSPGPSGVGMRSMRGRAEELGGMFAITGNIPNGTVVTAQIPLPLPVSRS